LTKLSGHLIVTPLRDHGSLAWAVRPLLDAEMNLFHAYDQAISPLAPAPTPKASDLVPANYYLQARRVRTWLIGLISAFLEGYDAVLMPATPAPPPKGFATTGNATLLTPWSFLGLPTITINGGLSPDGLPLGLQFAAARLQDYRLLQVGAWCEGVIGRLGPPPLAQG
jgi:hypothetical protein